MTGPSPTRWLDRLSDGRFAIVIAAPGLMLVSAFVLPPILATVGMSLFRIELLRDDVTPFLGFGNYVTRLPADSSFLATLPRTLGFAAITSALAIPLALGTAILIQGRGRATGFLGLVVLLPWAVAPIGDGILWRLMFEPRTGIVTYLLGLVGLPPVVIREAPGALLATMVAVTWRSIPLLAILFLAALRGVRPDVRRAAAMDGATSAQAFRHVTLPAITPVVIGASLLQLILALQVFEVPYALSVGRPPAGALLAGQAIFDTVIGDVSLGYGSAMTVVLASVSALLLGVVYVVIARWRGGDEPVPDTPVTADDPIARRRPRVRAVPWARDRTTSDDAVPVTDAPPAGRIRSPRGAAALRAGAAIALVVWLAGPILWVVVASTQPRDAISQMPPRLTLDLDLSQYARLITDPVWQGAAVTTITVSVIGTMLALGVALLAGYPLARLRHRRVRLVMAGLLSVMLIPPIALAIPILYLVIALGLRDSVAGLVFLNGAFWSPIFIWLVRGAFMGVALEVERAARIDGCSRLGALVRVSLPAAAPVIAAAAAIVFIGIWNDFAFVAVVGGGETETLPSFLGESPSPPLNVLATRIVLTIAPCLALITILRRRIFTLS